MKCNVAGIKFIFSGAFALSLDSLVQIQSSLDLGTTLIKIIRIPKVILLFWRGTILDSFSEEHLII